MRYVLRKRVLAANGGDASLRSFSSFRKSVVSGVKVFALLVDRYPLPKDGNIEENSP